MKRGRFRGYGGTFPACGGNFRASQGMCQTPSDTVPGYGGNFRRSFQTKI